MFEVFSNKVLFKVPFVARIPIVFVLVFKAAGLIAGSIPIKGILYFSLKKVIAFVVAVLQATTISLHFSMLLRLLFAYLVPVQLTVIDKYILELIPFCIMPI